MNQEYLDPQFVNQSQAVISDASEHESEDSGDQNSKMSTTSVFASKWLLVILIGLLLLLLLFFLYRFSVSQPTPQSEQTVEQDSIPESEKSEIDVIEAPQFSNSVFTLATDIQWQDDQLSYDVQRVYLVSDPTATASAELQPSEQLVVFAVQATDTRTFGDARLVPARNYLNTRRLSQDFPPMGDDSQQLLPGETTIVYVPFAIPNTEQKVTGLLGNLRNPYVVELDFQTGEQLEGSFDLLKGFMPALDTESSTPSAEATPSPTQPTQSN